MDPKPDIEEFRAYLERKRRAGWHVVNSELENSSSKPIELIVEPYGYPVIIPPGARYEVIAQEPEDSGMHIEFSDDYMQLYANGIVDVFDAGVGFGVVPWHDES